MRCRGRGHYCEQILPIKRCISAEAEVHCVIGSFHHGLKGLIGWHTERWMGQLSRSRMCVCTYMCLRGISQQQQQLQSHKKVDVFWCIRRQHDSSKVKYVLHQESSINCGNGSVDSRMRRCLGRVAVLGDTEQTKESHTTHWRLKVACGGNIVHSISHKYSEMPTKRILTCKFALTKAFPLCWNWTHCILMH